MIRRCHSLREDTEKFLKRESPDARVHLIVHHGNVGERRQKTVIRGTMLKLILQEQSQRMHQTGTPRDFWARVTNVSRKRKHKEMKDTLKLGINAKVESSLTRENRTRSTELSGMKLAHFVPKKRIKVIREITKPRTVRKNYLNIEGRMTIVTNICERVRRVNIPTSKHTYGRSCPRNCNVR